MPLMDGYETTERIRQSQASDSHVLVIALTASAMAADRQRCLDAGMDDYLTKPLRLEALTAALDRWDLVGSPRFSDDNLAEEIVAGIDDEDEFADVSRSVLDAHVLNKLDRLGKEAGVDLVGQLVVLFLADADTHVAAMQQALLAADPLAVARSAHALRGASANLGATDLSWVCETLEVNGGAGESDNAGKLWVGVRSVVTELELVRAAFAAQSTTI